MPRFNQTEASELRDIEDRLIALERHLINVCHSTPQDQLTTEFLSESADRFNHPDKYKSLVPTTINFFDMFDSFLVARTLSEWRIKRYQVLIRSLRRYEEYRRESDPRYKIGLDTFNTNDLIAYERFLRSEHELYSKYPHIYEANPIETRKHRKPSAPLPKGNNTIINLFSALRAFFNWCNIQGKTSNKPFAKYTGFTTERYGTPYYITIAERDYIADFDLSKHPELAIQRDIFIFHCLIGCRVSDLIRLTTANIIDGAVEYIATKTKGERPEVIRVPLHRRAEALINKYAGLCDGRLFPFISAQKYNNAIKKVFTFCGITRMVTVLNPTTGTEEQRPINEIASSHLARRTFIGNLYRQVKDPNLIGKLSGHTEGSKAFARYRDIDEEIKKDLINLLGD